MPAEPTTILRPLAKLVATHQQDVLLDALLGDTSDAEIVRRAERIRFRAIGAITPAELVLQEAARVLPKAATFLRRSPAEVQRRLGGCTLALVAVAAQQALSIHDTQRQRELEEETHRRQRATRHLAEATVSPEVVEQAQARMQRARREGAQRSLEIERLLTKVDAETPKVAVPRNEPDPGAVARALERCAEVGTELLRRGDEALLARAMLFGLDGATVQSWRHDAANLRDTIAEHEEALRVSRASPRGATAPQTDGGPLFDEGDVLHAIGTAVILLSHVVEAFEAGHRVDRKIPKLTSLVHSSAGTKRRRRPTSRAS